MPPFGEACIIAQPATHGDDDPQVSVRHALRAFDLLAPGVVSTSEAEQLLSRSAPLTAARDPLIKPDLLLRRSAGASRLTIYDGGHGFYPRAGIAWLAEHHRR